MAPKVGMFLTGDKQLDAVLSELPISLRKKGARKATRAVAKMTLAEARKLAPVATGALRKSLVVRAQKRSRKQQFKDDVGHLVITRDGMFKGDQFYGGFVELGTKLRRTKAGQVTGRIAKLAFDFLRPALHSARGKKMAVFRDELRAWLGTIKAK